MHDDSKDTKQIIGRAEIVHFPELDFGSVHARIDTGANTSAIWASHVVLKDGVLHVVFFGEGCPHYNGATHIFENYETTVVASSTGHAQQRYKIRLLIKLGSRKIRAQFTLADRSSQVYPVLIGRNILRGKFVVDVKHGKPLRAEEEERTRKLKMHLEDETKE